jgi:hypothetical protein
MLRAVRLRVLLAVQSVVLLLVDLSVRQLVPVPALLLAD